MRVQEVLVLRHNSIYHVTSVVSIVSNVRDLRREGVSLSRLLWWLLPIHHREKVGNIDEGNKSQRKCPTTASSTHLSKLLPRRSITKEPLASFLPPPCVSETPSSPSRHSLPISTPLSHVQSPQDPVSYFPQSPKKAPKQNTNTQQPISSRRPTKDQKPSKKPSPTERTSSET